MINHIPLYYDYGNRMKRKNYKSETLQVSSTLIDEYFYSNNHKPAAVEKELLNFRQNDKIHKIKNAFAFLTFISFIWLFIIGIVFIIFASFN